MPTIGRILHWSPRILGIAFALFIAVFSLDVFSEYSGWDVVLPLLIHLLPSMVLAAAVAIAWRYEWVGAIAFIGFAIAYLAAVGFDQPWSWYVAVPTPAVAIGLLFLTSWLQERKRLRGTLKP
jgi:hypothetical protein